MSDKLELSLLGTPIIRIAGIPVAGFNSKKVFALFCYLGVTGETHLRSSLAALLWGELPQASAQNNLRKALTNLRKIVGPFVDISRRTVKFNHNSPYWLDVRDFETAVANMDHMWDIQKIERAVELYRGDFLEGIYIHQAPAFDDWLLIQRARLRELALQALYNLCIYHTRLGKQHYPTAIDYARKLLWLEPYHEEAHRQLMLLLALNGQRSAALAQYKSCTQIMKEELDVSPSISTSRLFEKIRDDRLEPIPPLPQFLTQVADPKEPPLFVGRQKALNHLRNALDAARNGDGKVIFIAGGPGRGKTALLDAFARQSMKRLPDLLAAKGKCSAYGGIGDPYAPFREILGMFSGDVETQWKAGAISTDHARRLWEGMSLTTQACAECGHHVIDTLVDGSALLTRMTAASAPLISDGVKSLKALVNKSSYQKDDINQSNLFEQVTRVLFKLAELHPLLVILDDLQWVDTASAGLLFHLGRRIHGKRLLIACAYRPEEVSHHPDGVGERHPLEHILAEFKGRFADAYLDLARFDDSEGRSFINAYLDSESNILDSNFREALYKRTAGHPLFTIELLRAMQDEGNLAQDSDGTWFLKNEPNWRQIPTRVEGVIGKRIDRLNPELRDILRIASVEGDIFSAQVIADVIKMSERNVLRLLSGPLEKKHRVVSYSKEIKVGDHQLSKYSFAHVLYRDYAFNLLNPGERRLLHQRVGSSLEDFYQGRIEEIAVQLATHFVGDPEKERFYSRQAGEWAEARFANDEAIYHLNKALDLTPETDFKERYELLLALEKIHDLVGNRETQKQILMALQEVAESLHDPHCQATVALRQATLDWSLGNNSASIAQCMKAKRLLNSRPDPELEAEILRRWALSLSRLGNVQRARKFFKKSIKQAKIAGSRWLEAENYRHLGNSYVIDDDPGSAMIYFNKSLPILREVGNRIDQIRILHSMAMSNFFLFEYQKAKDEWEEALQICKEIGSAFYENIMRYSYTSVFEVCGQYEVAREMYQAALESSHEVEDRTNETRVLSSIGVTSYFLKDYQKALTYLRDALKVAKDIQETYVEAYISTAFGNVHLALSQYSEAVQNFNKSIELLQSLGMDCASLEPLSGLAQVYLEEKDLSKAMTYVENILKYLEKGKLPSTEQPLQIYFRCYRVLQARHDPRANIVLDTAHMLLQEWVGRIEDIELHSSFLENVPANRAILDAWKNRVESCSP